MLKTLQVILKGLFYRGEALSHTKFWSNIGYGVMTWAVITKVINSTASDDLLLIYISVTAMHTTASNLLSKYNFKGKSDDPA